VRASIGGVVTRFGFRVDAPRWFHNAGHVSPRGVAANRLEGLRDLVARLVGAILDGQAATSVKARHVAFAGGADDPAVAHYLDVVRRHPYRITDEDVERLRDAGLDDDAIFELTVAAALGAGAERLRVGLALLGREP
jgi:alkylhydroperoxidase family enzyme